MARNTEGAALTKEKSECFADYDKPKDKIEGALELGGEGLKEPERSDFEASPSAPVESHGPASTYQQQIKYGREPASLSLKNPLPALAVYVDVNISLALEMLRTAARAVVEEAAAAFLGIKERCKLASKLHRRLERLWLQPRHKVLARTSNGAESFQLGRLLMQQQSDVVQAESTEASLSDASTCSSLRRDGSSMLLTAQESVKPGDWGTSRFHDRKRKQHTALASYWLPLRRHDGTVIAPPVELLAAYAESGTHAACRSVARCQQLPSMPMESGSTVVRESQDMRACVVGLCVRSLLDLYIQAIRSLQPALLPEGSVVLMAAVNIPMMFTVLKENNLIVHPLDLDVGTLMPTENALQQAVVCWGHRIKALLCSHLYGGICDIEPLVAFCTKHKLLLIEDCAESFVGELYRGHPHSDVSFFSFGLIKTCTAGGGGIATVRRRIVAARMQSMQSLYPFSSRRTSLKKLGVAFGACFLQSRIIMKSLLRICNVPGWNPGTFLQSFVRGFPSEGELFKLLRVQPNALLLAVLLRRLELWNMPEFLEQQSRAADFARRLQHLGLCIPGCKADFKTFW